MIAAKKEKQFTYHSPQEGRTSGQMLKKGFTSSLRFYCR